MTPSVVLSDEQIDAIALPWAFSQPPKEWRRAFAHAILSAASAGQVGAPGATDAERAAWLADKIVAHGDYAKEAAAMLLRWPAASSVGAASVVPQEGVSEYADLLRQALARLVWWEAGYGDPTEDDPCEVIAALRARLDGLGAAK